MKGSVRVARAVACSLLLALISGPASAPAPPPTPPPGAPGSESYFDLARKDCVGTARNTTSKVWFTVANGVLSDTYWPTADNTNVEAMQYIWTDGNTLTSFQ